MINANLNFANEALVLSVLLGFAMWTGWIYAHPGYRRQWARETVLSRAINYVGMSVIVGSFVFVVVNWVL